MYLIWQILNEFKIKAIRTRIKRSTFRFLLWFWPDLVIHQEALKWDAQCGG